MSDTQPEITPEERATIAVRDYRWKNRAAITERQRLAAYAKTDEAKLDRHWQRNRQKLSAEEQAALQQQQQRAMAFRFEMDDTIGGIYEGRTAGTNMLWPDALLVELTAYLKDFPALDGIVPRSTAAALEPDDFEQLHPSLRDYGFQCRVPVWEAEHYRFCCWRWASSHKEDCDAHVFADLSAEFDKSTPAPATPAGVRTFTLSEEKSAQRHARDAEIHRRIAEGRRVSDVF